MTNPLLSASLSARYLDSPALKARRILAAAATPLPDPSTVIAAGQTVTIGGQNVASTINGATTDIGSGMYQPTDPVIEQVCGGLSLLAGVGYVGQTVTTNITSGARSGAFANGIAIATTATAVDFCCSFSSGAASIIAYVTDILTGARGRIQAADITTTDYYNHQYVKFAFAASAPKIIDFHIQGGADVRGINANAPIWRPIRDYPKICLFGDSFYAGVLDGGTKIVKLALPTYIGHALGIPNVFANSWGGTGDVHVSSAGNGNYGQRLDAGDFDVSRIGDQDLILIAPSVNDHPNVDASYTDTVIAAAYQSDVAKLMLKQPNAIILGCGPQNTVNNIFAQSRHDALQAAFAAAAGGQRRMGWMDHSPAGEALWADHAHVVATTGSGGVHLNDLGKVDLGLRIGNSMKKALRVIAGSA